MLEDSQAEMTSTESASSGPLTLAVDIGGSGVKAMLLDSAGNPLSERDRLSTPEPATPESVIEAIHQLAMSKTFDRVSVGFPGVVRQGTTYTAANLDQGWIGFNLGKSLEESLGKPVRVLNDADMQGFGAIEGQGAELVITLGTGVGFAMFVNGILVPNLELGHHPFRKGQTYEEQLGRAALDDVGKKRWNERLQKAIDLLSRTLNYDRLYLGGGNAKRIEIKLPENVKIVPNVSGLLGGIALWKN
ncbi:ROK family protein [Leptolyngbya ohadii]|uniref:ROK family protein n=1 Tax=Leptolyngbya ohadii TaxID=1962290 RepID=UPI001CEC7891|nr:ROK family protein [Leptolyngbya ohadii]